MASASKQQSKDTELRMDLPVSHGINVRMYKSKAQPLNGNAMVPRPDDQSLSETNVARPEQSPYTRERLTRTPEPTCRRYGRESSKCQRTIAIHSVRLCR